MSQAFDYLIDTAAFPNATYEHYDIKFDRVFRKATQVELLYAAVPKALPQIPVGGLTITQGGTSVDMATIEGRSWVSGNSLSAALSALLTGTISFDDELGRIKWAPTTNDVVVIPLSQGAKMALGLNESTTFAAAATTYSTNVTDLTYPRYLKLNLEFNNISLNGIAFPPVFVYGDPNTRKANVQKATFEIDMADSNFPELTQWYRNTRYDQRAVGMRSNPDFDTISVRWAYPDGTWLEDGAFQGVSHQVRLRIHAYTNPT